MKKKYFIGILIVMCLMLIGCGKKPGVMTISISTKDGIHDYKLKDEIVDIKKNNVIKKNTITDKKTGNTTIQEITEVRFDLIAKKKGKTTLTVEYKDYKTDEIKNKVYNIKIDKNVV